MIQVMWHSGLSRCSALVLRNNAEMEVEIRLVGLRRPSSASLARGYRWVGVYHGSNSFVIRRRVMLDTSLLRLFLTIFSRRYAMPLSRYRACISSCLQDLSLTESVAEFVNHTAPIELH